MNVRIYKIDTGLTGKNFSSDKRTNFPIGGKTNSFYSVGNLMRGLEDYFLQGNLYFIDNEEELEKFENPLGDRWIAKKQYYINHPKKFRENWLIESNKFHEYIFREQLEEMANYLHSELNINSLKIEVEEGNDFSAYTNLSIEEMKLNGEGKGVLKDNKTLEINWSGNVAENDPTTQVTESNVNLNTEVKGNKVFDGKLNEYLWIEDFKELTQKVNEEKASNKEDFSHNLKVDNSFEMSEKIAKKIGVNPTWLKKCCFKLTY